MVKLVITSDTHNRFPNIPNGDIFIHLGDFSEKGTKEEFDRFKKWLLLQKKQFKHVIVIPGNHDNYLILEGIRFFGSAYQASDSHWAFYLEDEKRKFQWDKINHSIDILLTHSPPFEILDSDHRGFSRGCKYIYETVMRLKPKYHFFGHVHEQGNGILDDPKCFKTIFYNCAYFDYFKDKPNSVIELNYEKS